MRPSLPFASEMERAFSLLHLGKSPSPLLAVTHSVLSEAIADSLKYINRAPKWIKELQRGLNGVEWLIIITLGYTFFLLLRN